MKHSRSSNQRQRTERHRTSNSTGSNQQNKKERKMREKYWTHNVDRELNGENPLTFQEWKEHN